MTTWAVQEIEEAFRHFWNTGMIREDWDAWADLFTEDVVYQERVLGTMNGRETIRAWIKPLMEKYGEIYGVYDWHLVDPSGNGTVVFRMENRRDNPSGEGWFDGWGLLQSLKQRAQAAGVQYVKDEAIRFEADGTGQITGVRTAGGARLQAERLGPLGHQLRKRVFAARQPLRDHDTGVIAGLDDDTLYQVFDLDAVADLQEHLRAAHFPGPLTDGDLILELQPAALQAVEDHVGRHQLAHRCRRYPLIRIPLEQHGAGSIVHDDGRPGCRLEGPGRRHHPRGDYPKRH